jgi:hypothetical protein
MSGPTCSYCGSRDTRLSHSGGWMNTLMKIAGRRGFRCRACSSLFFSSAAEMPPDPPATPAPEPPRAEVVVKMSPDEPVAGILVRAETQEELGSMLMRLNQALAEFGPATAPPDRPPARVRQPAAAAKTGESTGPAR